MNRKVDLLIVGAGPAGMQAAIEACGHGLDVMVADDQPEPGGQIWRAVERRAGQHTGAILGEEYRSGAEVARHFRRCGAEYRPLTQVWQIEQGWHVYMTRNEKASVVQADNILLATGAQERPAPFPGWTLPGVMTVGAAQIALKVSSQVPAEPVWIAGSGPLVLLYIKQLLDAGGTVAGWLDTSPADNWRKGMPHLFPALAKWRDLRKGYSWLRAIRKAGVPVYRNISEFRAEGQDQLSTIAFTDGSGADKRFPAGLLLVHEGIVPSIHMSRAIECEHVWVDSQRCFAPLLDNWGASSQPGVYIAGDGAGIAGARAAGWRGRIAALAIAARANKLSQEQADAMAVPLRRQLAAELGLRPMLDAMYPPRPSTACPSDNTIVCRCEELTAGDIRAAAKLGQPGPNQIKSFTRAGMGPCQGRQCGYTIANILAEAQERPVADVGFYRIRPPLKPLTLGELASLDEQGESS
ncbi:FAD-dependent oxidoreductase [Allopusillimonas soli]|uniref:FAD-dependent oxidoreductase n=1 Tax=Allopusillimonas soli TaxID=659016 RepID=A0A853F8H7_9BURK|nr:NAD(P)/FAD-dependent oxidoreductase [Allopusillimonas soli]NYT35872.1 FAD-dependent oxidoreductase [Allopusillimonas soli]TEA76236.1 FAD-dependent oxidoreductase [Allopusillimonas soli]